MFFVCFFLLASSLTKVSLGMALRAGEAVNLDFTDTHGDSFPFGAPAPVSRRPGDRAARLPQGERFGACPEQQGWHTQGQRGFFRERKEKLQVALWGSGMERQTFWFI